MPAAPVQISAIVSRETRALLDAATERRGLKKGHLIEEAIIHHLHALRELPADVIIPGRLVLTAEASRMVADMVLHPRAPNAAMDALMAGEGGDDVPG